MNEERNIPHVFAQIPTLVDEVILVDGNSRDATVEAARQCRPDVRVVSQAGRGKGDALRVGFERATGDIIVMADADGSTDLAEIPRFVEALLNGADFVKGSRYLPEGGSSDLTFLRKVGNSALSTTVNLLFGTAYTDLCYGYNAFWSHCLNKLEIDSDGFEVETLINVRLPRYGFLVTEIPSFEHSRLFGKSNLNVIRDGLRVLRTIVRERMKRQSMPVPQVISLAGVRVREEAPVVGELAG